MGLDMIKKVLALLNARTKSSVARNRSGFSGTDRTFRPASASAIGGPLAPGTTPILLLGEFTASLWAQGFLATKESK
jgi:hypothetical protein